jgi:tetratricopeptide (TPR) repeat protein
MKLGGRVLAEALDDDDESRENLFAKAFGHYQQVLELKQKSIPQWRAKYTEQDWAALACDDSLVHYQLAELYYQQHEWQKALDAYVQVTGELGTFHSDTGGKILLVIAFLRQSEILSNVQKAPAKAFVQHAEAVRIAEQTGDDKLLLRTLVSILPVSQASTRYQATLQYGSQATKIAQSRGLTSTSNECQLFMSQAYEYLGDDRSALEFLDKAIVQTNSFSQKSLYRHLLISILVLRHRLGGPDEDDLENVLQSIDNYANTLDKANIAEALVDLARVLYEERNPTKALKLCEAALDYLRGAYTLNRPDQKAAVLHRIAGLTQRGIPDLAKSKAASAESISILRTLHMPKELATALIGYGALLHAMNETVDGIAQVREALAIQRRLGMDTKNTQMVLLQMFIDGIPADEVRSIVSDNDTANMIIEMITKYREQGKREA